MQRHASAVHGRQWLGPRLAAFLAACAVAGGATSARGQEPTAVAKLRGDLAKIRAQHGGTIPQGAFESIAYTLDVASRMDERFRPQQEEWIRRARHFVELAAQGRDPIVAERGGILMRGYQSPISTRRQGYAIYIPKDYDPSRHYPLLLALHGGSANGNLFLGVVMGNNMNWKDYPIHLWDTFEPRWSPDWIVVAPDGFGQVMWRWMGEQDVLDVIEDVEKHYSVDPGRIVLSGLSNGGVGAYSIGMRHAWRFSAVLAIAGAPSWLQYAGGRTDPEQARALHAVSAMSLAENAINTDFRYYHGHHDTGPMRPAFVEEFGKHIRTLDVPFKEKWYDAGHDLLYRVHRHGKIYDDLEAARRKKSPGEVRVVTSDYRANRQHWVTVTRLKRHGTIARVRATAKDNVVEVATDNVRALSLDLRDAPLERDATTRIVVDGQTVHEGPHEVLGHVLHLVMQDGGFETGFPEAKNGLLEKRPRSAGPITDAYFDGMIHVYGTGVDSDTDELERAARRGAKGWPLWLWHHSQPVVADTEVTDAMMRTHHLVLYATPGANSVLERIRTKLPVVVSADGVDLGKRQFDSRGVGVKFIHPNPLAPQRYVIVQAGPTAAAVSAGNKLPDFLPDYVVYDARTTRSRPRLVLGKGNPPLALGYFDERWQVVDATNPQGGGEPPPDAGTGMPVPLAPPAPSPPSGFNAPRGTQAGRAARQIARRVPTFRNFRAETPGATWISDPVARWSIRSNTSCLESLKKAGIHVTPWEPLLPTPVPTPVELRSRVEGVWFRITHGERVVVLSCEMARRLPTLARILKRHGVRGVDVMSAYRTTPRPSFHTMGLALDLLRFWTLEGVLSVLNDFVETPTDETCAAPKPGTKKARALLDIACRLGRSKRFSTVLTPNYNDGHRDHFHIDSRPDDPRVFVR